MAAILTQARDAAAREDWAGAYPLLREADRHPTVPLAPGDLDALADSAWWSGNVDESVAARLRAHAAYVAEGDRRGAGRTAWWLSSAYRRLGRPVAAAGWLHRARHHLDGRPDCPEQCFLALADAEEAQEHHDPAAALAAARRMTRLADSTGSPDLLALSHQAEASVLLAQGRRAEGLALLDEVMSTVTAGGLSALFTGRLFCLALDGCLGAADLGRAVPWTDAAMAWCAVPEPAPPAAAPAAPRPAWATAPPPDPARAEPAGRDGWSRRNGAPAGASAQTLVRPPLPPAPHGARPHGAVPNPFRGLCRVHHVEVLDLLGEWTRAEEEAHLVHQEVLADSLDAAAAASYAAGDIQRRQGRRDEAARSYARAHELGRVPQPGLALLRLAEGRVETALAGLRLALDCQSDPWHDLLGRARLLAALTEVTLAAGETDAAEQAVLELEELGPPQDAPLLAAVAAGARGALALARGGPAHEPLCRALALWLELRVPYEAARARMLLAAADRAAGDDEAARLELGAARAVFARLGAVPDTHRAAALLAGT
ncbi:LuxR family transcriptional regulator [Streptomyces sp. NPDC053431]|uniref:LuxR family transcriptional regulator n=1 Tax=Streptomyces sp. NPDC053431 TaxID=3365703 RepID=UPI0037CFFACB